MKLFDTTTSDMNSLQFKVCRPGLTRPTCIQYARRSKLN